MKNQRNIGILIVFLLAVVYILSGLFAPNNKHITYEPLTIRTPAGEQQFQVQVATTSAEQETGLMFRKSLPENEGMLFPVQDVVMNMWMKDTFIPLDILFIDHTGKIITIEHNATPESKKVISAGVPVRAVLELAGGVTRKNHIDPGDQVVHAIFEP